MNDSWTVKIEIETINGSGRKYFISNPDDDGNHKDIGDEAFDNLTPTSKSNRIDSQQPKLLEQSNGSYFFSNQSYSPIKFELEPKENASMNAVGDHDHTLHRHDHLFEHCGWQSKSIPQSNSLAYLKHHSPQLNYANSVTALKEQIAKAKANFFKSEQPQFC
ncbi:zinc finger protein [Sarcoptes scabiei]|nr:zinc finger protein [Sarcoptes scabiei]